MVTDVFFFFCCLYQGEVEKEPQEMDFCPGLWFSRRPLLVVTLSVPAPSPQLPGPAKSNDSGFSFLVAQPSSVAADRTSRPSPDGPMHTPPPPPPGPC